ncbi:CYTH domain-containing protein [Qingshengfaniella alkalisoli]|uniref:CYTH domain-containing protein n=1 Tax=Qingshengfaniella alkalisoli TaxID=2599296 RepID=A0A5B8J269_9RHOB|nr:CYTH domain-containing protein [Qingshengfaniella alkalisoli]QDY71251.1 CYTH domain-containing protein [Qingshengfaniella alkalisoli]
MTHADPVEIERKFLVKRLPDLARARCYTVRQGYCTHPDDSISMRLRQKSDQLFLTVKTGEGPVRSEREIPIEAEQFNVLWPATTGRRIEKKRWIGPLGNGHLFELDIFCGAHQPLQMVEVEFDTLEDAEAFTPPDWFGREVSTDKAYRNKSIALWGVPQQPMSV